MREQAKAILENGIFCVNVLRDDQSWISDTFAGRFRDQVPDKFDCAEWETMVTGAPRVRDPLVAFDCRVVSSDLVGTHHVFFGEVQDIFIASTGSPLIYARRAYGAAARIEAPATIGAGQAAVENRVVLACFYTISAFVLPPLLGRLATEMPEMQVQLIEGDQSRIHAALSSGEAQIGLMYDESVAEDLAREILLERDPYVLVATDHPLADRSAIEPGDLEGRPMVLLSTPPSPDYFLGLLREKGIEPRVVLQSSAVETVRGLVANGLGYTLLASRPASDLSYDGKPTVAIPLAWDAPTSRVVLVRRARRPADRRRRALRLGLPRLSSAPICSEPRTMTEHRRIRPFNTRDTYPEQRLDNDLSQAVAARGTMVFLRGQCPQELDGGANVGVGDPEAHRPTRSCRTSASCWRNAARGWSIVTKLVVYLTDVRHRETVYRVMGDYIRGVHPVCTGLVVVALARPEWLVEIDATAVIPDGEGSIVMRGTSGRSLGAGVP